MNEATLLAAKKQTAYSSSSHLQMTSVSEGVPPFPLPSFGFIFQLSNPENQYMRKKGFSQHSCAQLAQSREKTDPAGDSPGLGRYGREPMRKQWFTAMLTLTAIHGFALGGDESSPPSALLPASVPASQSASPTSSVSAESAPHTGSLLDSQPGPDLGETCAKADGSCGPPGRFWVGAEYILWWVKDARPPSLVTTGPAVPTQIPPPGAPGGRGPWGFILGRASMATRSRAGDSRPATG